MHFECMCTVYVPLCLFYSCVTGVSCPWWVYVYCVCPFVYIVLLCYRCIVLLMSVCVLCMSLYLYCTPVLQVYRVPDEHSRGVWVPTRSAAPDITTNKKSPECHVVCGAGRTSYSVDPDPEFLISWVHLPCFSDISPHHWRAFLFAILYGKGKASFCCYSLGIFFPHAFRNIYVIFFLTQLKLEYLVEFWIKCCFIKFTCTCFCELFCYFELWFSL